MIKGGWDCNKSQILFALFTQLITLTTVGLFVEGIWPGLLLCQLSFFTSRFLFLSCSLAKLLLIRFQIKCMTDNTKDLKAAKRNISSDLWVQIKNKEAKQNKTLTKQNILLTQLLGNWSRKIYTELFRQYLYCSSLRLYVCFPRNEKARKNLWYSETIRVQILTFIKMSKCSEADKFF